MPLPSRRSLSLPKGTSERGVWRAYLLGLIGLLLLLLFGEGRSVATLGGALFLSGLALLLSPPKKSLGRWVNLGVLGFFGCLFFSFVPQFYWPSPDWRIDAVEVYGIDLPSTLTVHPWISVESIVVFLGAVSWFYVATSWEINGTGRRYFCFTLSLLSAALAGACIWGNYHELTNFQLADASDSGFFASSVQQGSFFALSGVIGFGFALEGLRSRKLMHLVGVFSFVFCLLALLMSGAVAGFLLLYFGACSWFLYRLRSKSLSARTKMSFTVLLLGTSLVVFFSKDAATSVANYFVADDAVGITRMVSVFTDTVEMFLDAPLLGHGAGTFEAIFPQYSSESSDVGMVERAGSDLMAIFAEVGLVGVVFLAIALLGYFKRCRHLSLGKGGAFRIFAFVAVLMFLAHSLIDTPGHFSGTAYFALLIAAFALPRVDGERQARIKPIFGRLVGVVLVLFGGAWMLAAWTEAPFYSKQAVAHYEETAVKHAEAVDYLSAISSVESLLSWNPMNWRAHHLHAKYLLLSNQDRELVSNVFKRASAVAPSLSAVRVAEGYAWLPIDLRRAGAAYTAGFERGGQVDAFKQLLDASEEDIRLRRLIPELSSLDAQYRVLALLSFEGVQFLDEIEHEFLVDSSLGQLNRIQRFQIVRQWITFGDLAVIDDYFDKYESGLKNSWWLKSLILKERASFNQAVDLLLKHIPPPALPEVEMDTAALVRLTREYTVTPSDRAKGIALISVLMRQKKFEDALGVTDTLIEAGQPPMQIYYWRGLILSELRDTIESWYALQDYLKQKDGLQ